MPFSTPVLGEGSPTKTDYRKKGALIQTSLLQDLVTQTIVLGDRFCVSVRPCFDSTHNQEGVPQ